MDDYVSVFQYKNNVGISFDVEAEKPFRATLASAVVYGLVSTWMYTIGMGAAIFTGESDIAVIMVKAGLGAAALAGLTGNLLFRVLKDAALDPVPAGLITLAFALVLYLAALQAQGVKARETLRLDW